MAGGAFRKKRMANAMDAGREAMAAVFTAEMIEAENAQKPPEGTLLPG
jgi:hypothetical protein